MVETIICTIDENIKSLYPDAKYWGLSRRENNDNEQSIFRYKGWGDNEYVGFDDTHAMNIYHRVLSSTESSDLNSGFGTQLLRKSVYNMRLVVFGNMRKINDTDKDVNYTIAPNVVAIIPNKINKSILDLLGVKSGIVQTTAKIFDRPRVFGDEMTGVEYKLHPETLLFAIDYTITLTYQADCVEFGCEPVVPKVTVIDGDNTIQLVAPQSYTCLAECDPVTITDDDGNVLYTPAAGTTQIIPSSPVFLRDTAGNLLSSGDILATRTLNGVAPDGTATATNSVGTQIGTTTVLSGGTSNIVIADTRINNSGGTLIANTPSTVAYNVADSAIRVEYVNGTLISNTNVKATDAATIQVPNPIVCDTLTEQITDSSTAVVVQAIKDGGKEVGVQDEINGQYGSYPIMFPAFGLVVNPLDSFTTADRLYTLNSSASSSYSIFNLPARTSGGLKSAVGNLASSIRLSVDGLHIMVTSTNTVNFYNYSDNVISGTFTVTGILNATFINSGNIWTTQGTTIQEYTQAGATVGTAFSSANVVRIRTLKNEVGTTRVWVLGDSGAATSGRISHIDSVTKAETTVILSGLPTGLTVGIVAGIEIASGRYFFTLRNGSTNFMAVVETTLTGVYVKHTQILAPQTTILGISSYIALPKVLVYIPATTANTIQYAMF